jgi:hypothetical protein
MTPSTKPDYNRELFNLHGAITSPVVIDRLELVDEEPWSRGREVATPLTLARNQSWDGHAHVAGRVVSRAPQALLPARPEALVGRTSGRGGGAGRLASLPSEADGRRTVVTRT